MTQNRSTAVMQRRVEARDSLDDFPTPPWATRAILTMLALAGRIDPADTCREPCANRGFMERPLSEVFTQVEASDVHDYGCGYAVQDYLFGLDPEPVDWTFMNPPFRLAQQFIERAIRTSRKGVCCIVRSAFAEGEERYRELFSVYPPAYEVQHCERVVMLRGRMVQSGAIDPYAEKPGTKASTATAYTWFVWLNGEADTRKRWVPKCRRQMEKPGDYPDYSALDR